MPEKEGRPFDIHKKKRARLEEALSRMFFSSRRGGRETRQRSSRGIRQSALLRKKRGKGEEHTTEYEEKNRGKEDL